jgi:hypothetical protein
MPKIHELEQWLQQQHGFEPVARKDVERVENSVKEKVAKPVTEQLNKQQVKLEEARTWYLR